LSLLPYDEIGDGAAVVLLHAGIADRRMWAKDLQPLADAGFRAVAIDLPGFGEGPVPTGGEDAPWDDVLDTLDGLGIERATLVGNSFGGAVALRVAAIAPDRVMGMVLVSPPVEGVSPSTDLEAAWAAEEGALEEGDLDGAVEAVLEHWVPADASAQLRADIAEMQRSAFEKQSEAGDISEGTDPLADGLTALAGKRIPALVLVGERDMPDFHEGAKLLTQTLPDARYEVLPGVAHLATLEAPGEFRALLLDFLAPRGAEEA
jgi:pimeloyl-ACP methyl ester carboxylesterase